MKHNFVNLLDYGSENLVSQDHKVNSATFSWVKVLFYLALN